MHFSHVLFLILLLCLLTKSSPSSNKPTKDNDNINEDIDDIIFDEDIEDIDFNNEMDDEEDEEEGDIDDDDDEYYDDDDDDGGDIVDDMEEDEERNYISSPDVEASYVFVDEKLRGLRIPIGKEASLLFGFTNTGEFEFQVFMIVGQIVNAENWNNGFQNFTRLRYNVTIQPSQTSTMLYNFKPHPLFDSRRVGIDIKVLYTSSENNLTTFVTSFFNETVQLIEVKEGWIDTKSFFIILVVFCGLVLVGYFVYNNYFAKSKKYDNSKYGKKGKSKKKKKKNKSNEDDEDDDVDLEWLSDVERQRYLAKKKKNKLKKK